MSVTSDPIMKIVEESRKGQERRVIDLINNSNSSNKEDIKKFVIENIDELRDIFDQRV